MAALLHVLRDADLSQRTIDALVKALALAQPGDWPVVMQTHAVSRRISEVALAELETEPDVAEQALELHKKEKAEEAAYFAARWAIQGLEFSDTYNVGRIRLVCKELANLVPHSSLWEVRLKAICKRWALSLPGGGTSWQAAFFTVLRPRWDGIYMGQARYLRRNEGSSMWIDYRRYMRLLPPDPLTGTLRALVLQPDQCSLEQATEALLNVNPNTHISLTRQKEMLLSVKQRTMNQTAAAGAVQAAIANAKREKPVEANIIVAIYEVRDGCVELHYPTDQGEFHAVLRVGHKFPGHFSETLHWKVFTHTDKYGETTALRLGHNSLGEPKNLMQVHYPAFVLRPVPALAHLY